MSKPRKILGYQVAKGSWIQTSPGESELFTFKSAKMFAETILAPDIEILRFVRHSEGSRMETFKYINKKWIKTCNGWAK